MYSLWTCQETKICQHWPENLSTKAWLSCVSKPDQIRKRIAPRIWSITDHNSGNGLAMGPKVWQLIKTRNFVVDCVPNLQKYSSWTPQETRMVKYLLKFSVEGNSLSSNYSIEYSLHHSFHHVHRRERIELQNHISQLIWNIKLFNACWIESRLALPFTRLHCTTKRIFTALKITPSMRAKIFNWISLVAFSMKYRNRLP